MTSDQAGSLWDALTSASELLLRAEEHQEEASGLCRLCAAPSREEEHLPTCLLAKVRESRFAVEHVIRVLEETHEI